MHYLVTLNIGKDMVHPNSRASFVAAARRWGAQYLEITQPLGPGGGWEEKLYLDRHVPDGRVVFLDADTLVRSDCPSPFGIVPPGTWGWVRNSIAGHRCTQSTVDAWFPGWAERLKEAGLDLRGIETVRDYANTGFMVFDFPVHRIVWEQARRCVALTGFDSRNWVISDQSPLCAGVHLSGTRVLHLSSLMHCFGEELWHRWTPEMKAFLYHFCGPTNKALGCGRTVWDEQGPERLHEGMVRWRHGKPCARSGGPDPLMLMREFARVWRGTIVEAGVGLGAATWYGATAARDSSSRYVCVDPWQAPADRRAGKRTYEAFLLNMRDAGLDDAVEVQRMTSRKAAPRFAPASVDLVLIDSDGTVEACMEEIDTWWPCLKTGGVMLGHNYAARTFPGVVEAVDRCFGAPEETGAGPYPLWKVKKTNSRRLRKKRN